MRRAFIIFGFFLSGTLMPVGLSIVGVFWGEVETGVFLNPLVFLLSIGLWYFSGKKSLNYLSRKGVLPKDDLWSWRGYVFANFLFLSYFVVSILKVPVYFAGRLNMGSVLIVPWIFLCIPVIQLLFSSFAGDIQTAHDKQEKGKYILLLSTVAIIIFGLLFRFQTNFPDQLFLKGIRTMLAHRLDIGGIREWRKTFRTDPEGSSVIVDISKWPKSIRDLKPNSVFLNRDGDLLIVWGGGFWHWGVCIYSKEKGGTIPSDNTLPTTYGYVWENG